MKIGFTGTREGMSSRQEWAFRSAIAYICNGPSSHTFHHGDCVGADAQAHDVITAVCDKEKRIIVTHPANMPKYRAFKDANETMKEKEPLKRNRDIVDACDILFAAPKSMVEQREGSGTWATIRYARKQGKPVILLDR